jgi:CRISPR system Cascade subunit CasD
MSVLLLQLAGPLQSWGVSGRFAWRTTAPAPTKSGVVGLLAGALGRERDADLSDLAALRFGVRADQPGTRVRDFQTAHHAVTGQAMPLSERFYLADAVFVAAVEGDDELVDRLHTAVREPHFLPYLGRRSCPPARPVELGVRGEDLTTALESEPWRASPWYGKRAGHSVDLDVFLETEPGERDAELQRDQPVSFDPRHRRYELRALRTITVNVANPNARPVRGTGGTGSTPGTRAARRPTPQHDPTALLESI